MSTCFSTSRWICIAVGGVGLSLLNMVLLAVAVSFSICYAPREVVIYAGGNDIDAGLPPELVFGDFVALMQKLRHALPQTKLVFISCPPSPKRWAETDKIKAVNHLIAAYCRHHDITFVNTFSLMLGADGLPRAEIYVEDHLHMNAGGYAIWREAVAPALIP